MNDRIDEIERVFMAFSDKTRLRLLYLMRNGEVSVNDLCEALEVKQPKVSRHLAYLRTSGMVLTRRDGKWVFYSIAPQESRLCSTLITDTLRWLDSVERDSNTSERQTILEGRAEIRPRHDDPNTFAITDMTSERGELEVYLL
ncbi:MAG: ArsR/SmtB family transcription factor [Pyrinomonadaceae bacterium]